MKLIALSPQTHHHPTTIPSPPLMALPSTSTQVYYFPPPPLLPTTARYPSPGQRPFHPAFGDVPIEATFPLLLSSPMVPTLVQILQKYELKALPFLYTPDSLAAQRKLDDYLQLKSLVWMDVIFPAGRVLCRFWR